MSEALALFHSTIQTRQGGTGLESQHYRDAGKKITVLLGLEFKANLI